MALLSCSVFSVTRRDPSANTLLGFPGAACPGAFAWKVSMVYVSPLEVF